MKDYPRLTEMGVTHPQQIAKFSVNSVDYTDFLRIVYDRPKGSFLPESRTYRFPRVQKAVKAAADAGEDKVVMETSPALREALEELRELVHARAEKEDIAAEVLAELQWLEEELCMAREHVKGLIDKVKAS